VPSKAEAARPAAVTLQRPVPVSLEPPVPLKAEVASGTPWRAPIVDPQIRPLNFEANLLTPPMVRGASPEPGSEPPLAPPSGPSIPGPMEPDKGMFNWRKSADEAAPAPRRDSSSTPAKPENLPAPLQSSPAFPPSPPYPPAPPLYSAPMMPSPEVVDGGMCFNNNEGDDHRPDNRFYANTEYLMYWIKGNTLPPLVTSATPNAGAGIAGALGQPDTLVLFGGNNVGNQSRSGGRFLFGWWFDDDHSCGIEGVFFFTGQSKYSFASTSSPSGVLALPYNNAATGGDLAFPVAFAGLTQGAVMASLRTQLWGSEINLRKTCWDGDFFTLDAILGFRQVSLQENLSLDSTTTFNQTGAFYSFSDRFNTHNDFFGAQTGVLMDFHFGYWDLGLKAKLALGGTSQQVDIGGANGRGFFGGNELEVPHNRNRVSFLPEVGAQVGYQICDNVRCFFGYDLLYWTGVALPGNEINRTVSTMPINPLPAYGIPLPGTRPFAFHDTNFWAQGITLGLEFKW